MQQDDISGSPTPRMDEGSNDDANRERTINPAFKYWTQDVKRKGARKKLLVREGSGGSAAWQVRARLAAMDLEIKALT